MTKEELLLELCEKQYVTLKPSGVHGIGVFAINPIPKGCREMFAKADDQWIRVSFEEVNTLPDSSRYLVENFCLFDDTHYFIPAHGFKKMDISLYINHSDNPNIATINEGEFFEALRDIHPGEELFVDYGTLVDSEE